MTDSDLKQKMLEAVREVLSRYSADLVIDAELIVEAAYPIAAEHIAARPRPSFDERVDYETRIIDLQETLAEVANLISKKLNEDDE